MPDRRTAWIALGLAVWAGACAPGLGRYRFESIEPVAREAIAAPDSFAPRQAPHPWYLRVHFSSETNLDDLAGVHAALRVKADLCPLRDPERVQVLGPYAVGRALAVEARTAEGEVAPGLGRVFERDASGRYAYTAYVVPSRVEAGAAYDLTAAPRDLCLRLEGSGGPGRAQQSNVFVAPAREIDRAMAQRP
jgi:hypothetical protein